MTYLNEILLPCVYANYIFQHINTYTDVIPKLAECFQYENVTHYGLVTERTDRTKTLILRVIIVRQK